MSADVLARAGEPFFPLSFVSQLRCRELAPHIPWAPASGLLSIFLYDELGSEDGRPYCAFASILHTEEKAALERRALPPTFQAERAGSVERRPHAPCSAELVPIWRLPASGNPVVQRLFDEEWETLERYEAESPYDFGVPIQVGGYRDGNAYDLEPDEKVQLVLQLPSDDTLDVEFGDVQPIYIYANLSDLEAGTYNSVYVTMG